MKGKERNWRTIASDSQKILNERSRLNQPSMIKRSKRRTQRSDGEYSNRRSKNEGPKEPLTRRNLPSVIGDVRRQTLDLEYRFVLLTPQCLRDNVDVRGCQEEEGGGVGGGGGVKEEQREREREVSGNFNLPRATKWLAPRLLAWPT